MCLRDVALGHRGSCARVCTCSSYLGSNSVIIVILKIIEPVGLNENNMTFSESFDSNKSDLIYLSEHFVIRLGTCYWEHVIRLGTCYWEHVIRLGTCDKTGNM